MFHKVKDVFPIMYNYFTSGIDKEKYKYIDYKSLLKFDSAFTFNYLTPCVFDESLYYPKEIEVNKEFLVYEKCKENILIYGIRKTPLIGPSKVQLIPLEEQETIKSSFVKEANKKGLVKKIKESNEELKVNFYE